MPDNHRLFHVTRASVRASILRGGILPHSGSWYEHIWTNRIFFATTLIGAYEFGMNIKDDVVIFVVDARKLAAQTYPDYFFDLGVWIEEAVPRDAIIDVLDFDPDFLESAEFLRHMGHDDE